MADFSLGEAVLGTSVDLDGLKSGFGQAESLSKSGVDRLTGALTTGLTAAVAGIGVAVAGAVAGFGAAAFQAGQEMDAAFDTILTKTGATGETLETLKDDFKQVFTSIPTEAEPAAGVIATLNTRLGVTGDSLTNLANVCRQTK